MDKFEETKTDPNVLEEASFWLARLDRGLEKSEEEELALWMLDSKDHQIALKKMCVMWGDMSFFEHASNLIVSTDQLSVKQDVEVKNIEVKNIDGEKSNASNHFKFASAATFLIALSALVFYSSTNTLTDFNDQMIAWGLKAPESNMERYETEVGQVSVIALSDGTEVTLNTDSVIEVSYSDKQRSIYLLSGEAFFDVAHNPAKPFVVHVGEHKVQAVGTAFNIDFSSADSIDVLVTEGKVKVATPKTILSSLITGNAEKSSLAGVGEQIIIDEHKEHGSYSRSEEDINVDLAWHDGLIIFEDALLPEVLKELSRYSLVEFDLIHADLKNVRVAGLFKADDLDGVLYSLDVNFGIASRKVAGRVILSRKAN